LYHHGHIQHKCCIFTAQMLCEMKKEAEIKIVSETMEPIARVKNIRTTQPKWKLESEGNEYSWSSKLERVNLIRSGIPYESIEVISKRINIPVKEVLAIFGLPQTTYNKKRREKSRLSSRESEVVLLLVELFDFGVEVFNNEHDKFQHWMKNRNLSLGNHTPVSFLDSVTGIQEVKNCLNRIEYGNFA